MTMYLSLLTAECAKKKFPCLATTDLLGGLIAQKSIGLQYISFLTENCPVDPCFYTAVITTFSFTIVTALSLLTMSAISVGSFSICNLV